MKPLYVPDDLVTMAGELGDRLGPLNNSIRNGKGNLAGYMGQLVASEALGWEHVDEFHYDLITPGGLKIDVKTKERTVFANDGFLASVSDHNIGQECWGYLFVNVYKNFMGLWVAQLMGTIERDEFYRRAFFAREGEPDPTDYGPHPFRFRADCYNLAYGELDSVEDKIDARRFT